MKSNGLSEGSHLEHSGMPPLPPTEIGVIQNVPVRLAPVKDRQTVSSEGKRLDRMIEGVLIDHRPLHEDERGELQEMYSPAWGLLPDPLVYTYFVSIRPNQVRGWVVHRMQEDRLFIAHGTFRVALFDDRPESPTYKMLNVFILSERNRGLVIIPRGVYHALKNVGSGDAFFINMPTVAYNHANPDKFRLPLKNDLIPFSFEEDSRSS